MKIFLPRIAANTKRSDIYDFVTPALKNGPFRKPGRILSIGILALRDLRTGMVEHHGLVTLESYRSLQQSLQRLQNRLLNGAAIQVRQYCHRSWYNDPRLHGVQPNCLFLEKRQGDRRRGSYIERVKHVADHINSETLGPSTLQRQHYLANFIVPAELAAMVAGFFASFKLEPLTLNNVLNPGNTLHLVVQPRTEHASTYFQIYAAKPEVYSLLDKLRAQYRNSGIQYLLTSIAESGEI